MLPYLPPGSATADKIISEIRQRLEAASKNPQQFWGRWNHSGSQDVKEGSTLMELDSNAKIKIKRAAPSSSSLKVIGQFKDWIDHIVPQIVSESTGCHLNHVSYSLPQEACKDEHGPQVRLKDKGDQDSPSARTILTGDISAWIPLDHPTIEDNEGSPSEILRQFALNQALALQFICSNPGKFPEAALSEETRLIRGSTVLFFSRGLLDAEIFLLPQYSHSALLHLLTNSHSKDIFDMYESEELDDAMDIVKGLSFFQGAAPNEFFCQEAFELSMSVKSAAEKCRITRESLADKSSLPLLHSQLVLDVIESLEILKESGQLLPLLRSTVVKFIESAISVNGAVESLEQDRLQELLCGLEIEPIKELRAFLLKIVSRLVGLNILPPLEIF